MSRLWKVTGTRHGRSWSVRVRAEDHNAAVRKGSHHPHMLAVRDVVLVDEPLPGELDLPQGQWTAAGARRRVGGTFGT